MEEQIFFTVFYRTATGNEPVREFLRALPRAVRLKIGEYMGQLEWRGLGLKASHIKKLSSDIWELRPEYGGIEYRLYFAIMGKEAVYVHVVAKKRQKAGRDDIRLAQRRFDQWKAARDDADKRT